MTTITTATAAVDDHGGATPSPPAVPTVDDDDNDNSHSGSGRPWWCHPLPPLPSLITNAFASLSLLALSVAFGRSDMTNTRALLRTHVVVIVVVAVAVRPPQWALRHDHRWGGAVGSALARMLLDDMTQRRGQRSRLYVDLTFPAAAVIAVKRVVS